MINYHVRSRQLVDLANDIKAGKMILSPYFQRKLVWRTGHKVDFIKTILLGLPFPEIFIARGTINVETMESTQYIVDGQQRMNSIREFIAGGFDVDGRKFGDLSVTEKEEFLKYEIAVIDLDLAHDDRKIIEIFKRLNRTYYALSNIEKMATEYASSEFMLVAKLLSGELRTGSEEEMNVDPDLHEEDPNVTPAFIEWANSRRVGAIRGLILGSSLFSQYEISRKVHLMYALNLMSTALDGYYNRNDKVREHLDQYAQAFERRDEIVKRLNDSAIRFAKLKLRPPAFWHSKSTSFSLLLVIDEVRDAFESLDVERVRERLGRFASSPPHEYTLAAKEGVNNKKERTIRYELLAKALRGD